MYDPYNLLLYSERGYVLKNCTMAEKDSAHRYVPYTSSDISTYNNKTTTPYYGFPLAEPRLIECSPHMNFDTRRYLLNANQQYTQSSLAQPSTNSYICKWNYPGLNVLQKTVFIHPSSQRMGAVRTQDYTDEIKYTGAFKGQKRKRKMKETNEQQTNDTSLQVDPQSTPRSRRKRICYSGEQVDILEKVFASKHMLDETLKSFLSIKLNVDIKRIQIWFKNRRAKERKLRKLIDPEYTKSKDFVQ